MENKFRLKPIQPELKHLVLAYNETLDEYNLVDLQHNVFVRDYKTIFYEKDLQNINLKNYEKERYYTEEERERMKMLKLLEQLYHVSDRRIIHQEIHKLPKEDLADLIHLVFLYAAQKPCTPTVAKIAMERQDELNED